MPVHLSFDTNLSLVVFEYSGDVTIEEHIQANKQLHDSPHFPRYNKGLNIFHADVAVRWTTDDFFHYKAKLKKQTEHLKNLRVAVVTESSLIYGMYRMYEHLGKANNVYADHKTFSALDKACDWLDIPVEIFQERFQHEVTK